MKRLLMFVLILAVATAVVAACGDDDSATTTTAAVTAPTETTAASTETTAAATETTAAVTETTAAAGSLEGASVAFCVPTLADAYVQFLVEGFKTYYTENAPEVTVEIGDCAGSATTQISQVENYVAMGVKQIVILPMNPFGMETVIDQARAAGVQIMYIGARPETEIDLFTGLDNTKLGENQAKMALRWLDQQYPDAEAGSVHAANFVTIELPTLKQRADAITAVLSADPRVKITYVKEGGPDTSNSVAEVENALTADPEIKLFMVWTEDIGLGADAVLNGRADVDVAQYGIFGAGLSDGSSELIELSKTNESAFRGTITYASEGLGASSFKLLTGVYTPPIDVMDTLGTVNSVGYEVVQ